MSPVTQSNNPQSLSGNSSGLSYKFQRLRERLRHAVASGELAGKLPGERVLARRFHVNAKTLSKALTDLAAEGLLDRSIGRGTYVKGSAPQDVSETGRCLMVCEPDRLNTTVGRLLKLANPELQIIHQTSDLRPSFLKQFDTIIDFGVHTSDSFLRDMVVRNMTVVAVNREPQAYSLNVAAVDRALGVANLTRDLLLAGHRHIAVIETLPRSIAARVAAQTAPLYAGEITVTSGPMANLVERVRAGATAVICDDSLAPKLARQALEAAGIRVPDDVALGGVGCKDESICASGYYTDCDRIVQAVTELIARGPAARPATLWLAPQWVDLGTLRPQQFKKTQAA